jgi:hypothetical protein
MTNSIHELWPDGTCIIRTNTPDAATSEEEAQWEYLDPKHWRLRLFIPPDPQIPGMEDGAVEVIDYEVSAEEPGRRMSLMQFDVEFPFEWEKLDGL